ncbi:MAG: flagellin [Pseudomonadota bacterium]
MALVINTNTMSLNAQRNLSTSAGDLATSLQRLSSGLRINSAKDDAAGLAISERFTTQIRGLTQAARNANDGISLAQTTEGALGEMTNNLQRIRELAVQAANSTNSASDRAALDQEVQQRLAEIDRIARTTSFNGQRVLDGSFGNAQFQVGANAGETIGVSLTTSMKTNALGQIASAVGTAVTNVATAAAGLTVQLGSGAAVNVGASASYAGSNATYQGGDSAYAKLGALQAAGINGLTASATNAITEGTAFANVTLGTGGTQSYAFTVNGVTVYQNTTASAAITANDIVAGVNANANQTGVTATVAGGKITLTATDARNIVTTEAITLGTGGTGTGVDASATGTFRGSLTLNATENITLGGANRADFGFGSTSYAKDATTLVSVNVLNTTAANDAMLRVDAALTSVSSLRSTLGAIQSRFESTITNLQTTTENLSASRSRILDTDFAEETATLTKAQILQQAGTAILAQANAVPQNVLTLLR